APLASSMLVSRWAKLAFWDVVVLGRPACSDRFVEGFCRQRLRIRREGRMLLQDQLRLEAGDRLCQSRQGLFGASTAGLAVFTETASEALINDWLSCENTAQQTGTFSLTQRGELLLARYLGEDAQCCRAAFSRLWQALNSECYGHCPAEPRIWHT
ncbi:MAG: urease accessory protein UreD, partial [Pseudomonadota bacterium]